MQRTVEGKVSRVMIPMQVLDVNVQGKSTSWESWTVLDVGDSCSSFCKSSSKIEMDTWKFIYSDEPGLNTLDV